MTRLSHPNEVVLVRRGEATGQWIPATGYQELLDDATALGPEYVKVMMAQVARQKA